MKKELTIMQEHVSPLVISDNDDQPLVEYTKEVAKVLENTNVTLLHTSSCSIIIRPHKISSIIVRELPSKTQPKKETKEETPKEESLDGIISD